MTVQEARKELELSRDQQGYAEEMKQRIDELNTRALNAKNHKISNFRVQSSLNAHALEDEILKLMGIKTEYIPFIVKMEEELIGVERKIMRLMYPYNMVLFLRYIQGENFKEIAGKLGYHKNYCNELTLEGEKLYAALLPLAAANQLNPKNDLKFYRANNLYIEYKKQKLSSLSELKTELASMIKEVDTRCYPDCKVVVLFLHCRVIYMLLKIKMYT